MAANVQPKADQPRVTTESLKRGEQSPNIQYRVSTKSYDRNTPGRTSGRAVRS
jgi:hypothetical protein